jgi:tripartite-type tricarboxylate transporter receptor subunit TctC
VNHIPYKGTGQGITDVMGGHVPLMFGALPSTLPWRESGEAQNSGDIQRQPLAGAAGRADGGGSGACPAMN